MRRHRASACACASVEGMSDRREPPTGAARPASFWRKTYLDPVLLVLVALSSGLAVWGVWRTATDPDDASGFTAFLLMGKMCIRDRGTTTGSGFVAQAVPTARTAFGLPTSSAISL